MRHGVPVKKPCAKCVVAGKDIVNTPKPHDRSLRYKKMVRTNRINIPRSSVTSGLDKKEESYGAGGGSGDGLLKSTEFRRAFLL